MTNPPHHGSESEYEPHFEPRFDPMQHQQAGGAPGDPGQRPGAAGHVPGAQWPQQQVTQQQVTQQQMTQQATQQQAPQQDPGQAQPGATAHIPAQTAPGMMGGTPPMGGAGMPGATYGGAASSVPGTTTGPVPGLHVPDPAQPQGPSPATKVKGFFSALLDMKFEESITARLVRVFYAITLFMVLLTSVVMVAFGIWVFQYGWLLGVATLLATPALALLEIVMARIFLEFVINQFRITEELKEIRQGMDKS